MKFVSLLILIFSFMLASCSNGGGGTSEKAKGVEPAEFSGNPGDCKEFIKNLPQDYFHDWIDVPENPLNPTGPQIKVFYYGRNRDGSNVVIFYNGGPGSDSHGNHRSFDNELTQRNLKSKISFVYMDQRGTGCSTAYPSQKTDEDILRSRWWGSTGIVYDSEALRKKLVGSNKWKIFGQSYGAFIVHRYVSLFPQSIDKAYAHANTISPDPMSRLQDRIESQVKVQRLFFANYPQDKDKFVKLIQYLTPSVCFQGTYGKYCGHEILEGTIQYLGFSNYWPNLDRMINKVVLPDGSIDVNSLNKFVGTAVDEEGHPGYTIAVIGIYDRNVLNTDTSNCKVIREAAVAKGISDDELAITECSLALQVPIYYQSLERIKNVLNGENNWLTLANFKTGLQQMAAKSFFLYSGEKDTFVPEATFKPELDFVGDLLNYTHFMGSGHEGYRTEAQVWSDLLL